MKPKTKKTLIIAAAAVAIALIVWLLFFRKKEWEKEIDALKLTDDEKRTLKSAVRAILNDPTLANNVYLEAQEFHVPKAQWLVITAAQSIGWPAGMLNGKLNVVPRKS